MSRPTLPGYPANRRGAPAYSVLGPALCKGCGLPVYWSRSRTREGWNGPVIPGWLTWREPSGAVHKCRRVRKKAAA